LAPDSYTERASEEGPVRAKESTEDQAEVKSWPVLKKAKMAISHLGKSSPFSSYRWGQRQRESRIARWGIKRRQKESLGDLQITNHLDWEEEGTAKVERPIWIQKYMRAWEKWEAKPG